MLNHRGTVEIYKPSSGAVRGQIKAPSTVQGRCFPEEAAGPGAHVAPRPREGDGNRCSAASGRQGSPAGRPPGPPRSCPALPGPARSSPVLSGPRRPAHRRRRHRRLRRAARDKRVTSGRRRRVMTSRTPSEAGRAGPDSDQKSLLNCVLLFSRDGN